MKNVFFLLAITFALTLSATSQATNDVQIGIEQCDVAVNPMVFVAVETVTDFATFTFTDVCADEPESLTVTPIANKRTDRIENRIYKRCEVWLLLLEQSEKDSQL
jgi:hypothetical protein